MSTPEDQTPPRAWWNGPLIVWDMLHSPTGRVQLGLYLFLGTIAFAGFELVDRVFVSPLQITPENQRFGWNAKLAKKEAPRIAAMMPKFEIRNKDNEVISGAGKSAELWRYGKLANNGLHIPTWKQESGDCVSMGWSNAIAYRQAFQIAQEQRNETLKIPFPPYAYGVSRVLIGKRQLGRGAGSVGAWAAQGSLSYGVLPTEQAAAFGYAYSGRLADAWGWTGPPKPATDFGQKFRIRTVSQVKSWEDVRDALVHGYPCTVASNIGFEGQFRDIDGKRWGTAAGEWGHQMCFIGCEDRPGRTKGCYVINSWGADAHPKPLNDEPLGGFWVKWQDVQRMVSQLDSWAYSDFDGFPNEATADWNKFRARAAERSEQLELSAAEQPDPQPVLLEVRQMFQPSFLLFVLVVGVAGFMACMKIKASQRQRGILSLLLALSLVGMGSDAVAGPRAKRFQMFNFQASQGMTCKNGICTPGSQCGSTTCKGGETCVNGVCTPTPAEPSIQLAAAGDELPPAVWNAFAARAAQATPRPPANWNAMAPSKHELRTYRDCYTNETDFVLVVGKRAAAEKQLILTERPVAFEFALDNLPQGNYRVFEVRGLGKRIEPLIKAQHFAGIATPRMQSN